MANRIEVHCTVSNCHYWKQGNLCDANQILVTNDRMAAREPDSVDAPQASRLAQTTADRCEATCCKTFVHQGSEKTGVDGVYRL
jgi:hypothetical protein